MGFRPSNIFQEHGQRQKSLNFQEHVWVHIFRIWIRRSLIVWDQNSSWAHIFSPLGPRQHDDVSSPGPPRCRALHDPHHSHPHRRHPPQNTHQLVRHRGGASTISTTSPAPALLLPETFMGPQQGAHFIEVCFTNLWLSENFVSKVCSLDWHFLAFVFVFIAREYSVEIWNP